MQRELHLSLSDRKQLDRIQACLAEARDAMALISEPAKKHFAHINVPSGTLPYCLKWGIKACDTLITLSSAQEEAPIWVSQEKLCQSLKITPSQVQRLVKSKVIPVWKRNGVSLFDLVECRNLLKRKFA